MQLPDDSVGITDMIAWRECPRRFSYGMRRHTGLGRQSDDQTPEAGSVATDYGSAIHEVIQFVEDGWSDEDAVQKAWANWGHRLEPSDIALMHEDIATYRARDYPRTETLANENEFRVPLFVYEGTQIYFRFKLDRLLRRLDAPDVFIAIDYKSSRHAKSEKEVHADPQLWGYNWGIHEFWPECRQLLQAYDQLRYGKVPTRKTDEQRRQMKQWMIATATAIIEDRDVRDDGLLKPRKNQWCPWCPVIDSCAIVPELTDFARVELDALMPATKVGRKTVADADPKRIGEYIERMEDAKTAMRTLERFVDAVKELLRNMPAEDRLELGYDLRGRKKTTFDAEGARQLHERLGDQFYSVLNLTKTGLQSYLADDPELLDWALGLAQQVAGPEVLMQR